MTATPRDGRAGQSGLTLIELMVVVAIVGILMAIASVSLRTDPTVQDVAYRVANLIQEASRKAIATNPVPPEDITGFGVTRPIRVEIATDGGTGFQDMTLWRWDATNDEWDPLTTRFISDRGIEVYGYRTTSETAPGLGPAVTLGSGSMDIFCEPQGTCDAMTLYLHDRDHTNVRARVVVMPLSGTTYVFSEW